MHKLNTDLECFGVEMNLKGPLVRPFHFIVEEPQSLKANDLPKSLTSHFRFQFSGKPHFKCMRKKAVINSFVRQLF